MAEQIVLLEDLNKSFQKFTREDGYAQIMPGRLNSVDVDASSYSMVLFM